LRQPLVHLIQAFSKAFFGDNKPDADGKFYLISLLAG
jgi:hypothetical protein